jgi:hypothetical protein
MGSFITLVFCLMAVVSAIVNWRRRNATAEVRNKNLKTLALCAIWIGLCVLAFIALPKNLSVGVTVGLIVGFILVGTIGLILAARAINMPKLAPLPANVTYQRINRDKALKPLKGLGIFFLVVAALALLLPGVYRIMGVIMAGTVVLIFGLALGVGYIKARDADRALTTLDYTASIHWQFPAPLWQQWIDTEVGRTAAAPPRFEWKKNRGTLITMVVVVVGFAFLRSNSTTEAVLISSAVMLFIVAMVFLGKHQQKNEPDALRKLLSSAPPSASFGPDGYACAGTYTNWAAPDCFLLSATRDNSGPSRLAFVFRKTEPSGRSFRTFDALQTVPIPPGGESDLAALQRQLAARCPEASVRLA